MTSELAPSRLSLTGLVRLTGLVILLGLAALGIYLGGADFAARFDRSALQTGEGSRIARRLIVYRLDPARPTVFRFTQPTKLIRVFSTPTIESRAVQAGREWDYGIRAQLLAADGRILATHDVFSRSGLIGSDGNRLGNIRLYRGSSDAIGLPDELRLASAEPAAALVLFAGPSRPQVKAIDVRVYERRGVTAGAALTGFSRLSPGDQARLARANAFPTDMLTASEKGNIAINQWRPIGPTGIEGRDYRMLVQYESEQPDPEDGEGAE
jgi:hypothetical protein